MRNNSKWEFLWIVFNNVDSRRGKWFKQVKDLPIKCGLKSEFILDEFRKISSFNKQSKWFFLLWYSFNKT